MGSESYPIRVALFGAPLDTGNLGVSALAEATLHGLFERVSDIDVTVFDNSAGRRSFSLNAESRELAGTLQGAWISRRLYRGESLWSMLIASKTIPSMNDAVSRLAKSTAVLDISGGDSFADIYGSKQLDLVTLPKTIALNLKRPLLLLPQTYGPFQKRSTVRSAGRILRGAKLAWARDQKSIDRVRDVLGDDFDPQRHRLGVDMAFGLPSSDPGARLGPLTEWITSGPPVVGMNVSGLLGNTSAPTRQRRFRLGGDYVEAMVRLAERITRSGVRVLLIPHVRGTVTESDEPACAYLASRLPGSAQVMTLPAGLSADQVKHVIGRMDWFIGARMHSTIAALSARIPVVAVAYSDKFQGVFDDCGVGERVLDARRLDTTDLAEAAYEAWRMRAQDVPRLVAALPHVEQQLQVQLDEITQLLRAESDQLQER